MAKAINWPQAFRTEIIAEDSSTLRCALRLGDLYFKNHFWTDGEVVDIRVNHLKVRKAQVKGELKCCPIHALTAEDYQGLKSSLKTPQTVIEFLGSTYNQSVDENTLVTVVYYTNQPVIPDEMDVQDDPHMG